MSNYIVNFDKRHTDDKAKIMIILIFKILEKFGC